MAESGSSETQNVRSDGQLRDHHNFSTAHQHDVHDHAHDHHDNHED